MKVVAIIPARGGSKGIPRKNLALFCKKPLVTWSVEHALASEVVNRVIVSSDDAEILQAAREAGAETPFVRPAELAEDHVLDLPVFEHALRYLEDVEGYKADLIVHLRPTTPYRKPVWIDEAVRLLAATPEAHSVRSVSKPDQHPYRIFRIGADGYLDPIMKHEHPEPYLLRRQDLPAMYYYNCVVDIARPSTIFEKGSMTGNRILPYVMDPNEVIDIDAPRDLVVANCLFGDGK